MFKKVIAFVLTLLVSILPVIAFAWLRGGYISPFGMNGLQLSTLVFMVIYFAVTILLLNKCSKTLPIWVTMVAVLIGASAIEILIAAVSRGTLIDDRLGAFIDYMVRIEAILLGLWYYLSANKTMRLVVVGLLVLSVAFCTIFGVDLWLDFVKSVNA